VRVLPGCATGVVRNPTGAKVYKKCSQVGLFKIAHSDCLTSSSVAERDASRLESFRNPMPRIRHRDPKIRNPEIEPAVLGK